ncbi:MAG: FeS-binding protein [Bacteroidetes bacterium HGW-Bacteroidetes-1]|nr:MAG: FeS-binding protein [Bacteroidetes bacterium HGW-Bacteroidetes-1]
MDFILKTKLEKPGIKNNGIFFKPLTSRGWIGIALFVYLVGFYILLYFYPFYITEMIAVADPVSILITGTPAGKWFLYGLLYTLFVGIMGVRFIVKYRHNRYQVVRTLSVIFFQTAFAFIIPQILTILQKPYIDFKNIWPLDYSFFFSYKIQEYLNNGTFGFFMLGWGLALMLIGVPLFTYFFGKRWYCSWVCGCGGLAETAGDPFRQLSNKSLKAWKFERISIYSVLIFAILMTLATLYSFFTEQNSVLGIDTYKIQSFYGFLVGSILAGVIGTGFYPVMGNRVWCRFFCPLAAYLGIVQRYKSRFRITTNGGQCISCGNCSTYCEMGIDVRAYAQKGQNIVRASCVGCGICAAVCPRGVLKLENADPNSRIKTNPVLTGNLNNQ